MLITKSVKVKWNSKIKKHYEKKGYIYTKMGEEFEVKVEDLTYGSAILVDVKCDCEECKNPYLKPMAWKTYLRCVKEDGKYCCQKCAMKTYGSSIVKSIQLSKSKSFEQWCIDNNKQDVLDRWDYDSNIEKNGKMIRPSEVCYSSQGIDKKGYWFKCLKNIKHKSELKKISNFTRGQEGSMICIQCNSFAQYLIDNYGENALGLYWDYEKNTVNPWEVQKCSRTKIWIKCQNTNYHKSYGLTCSSFTTQGNRCPYCSNKHGKIHPLDSLGKLLENKGVLHLWSDNNKKAPYKYAPKSQQKVWWRCENEKHKDYRRNILSSNSYDFRCPECVRERDESFLQEKVRLYLNELGYKLNHEHNCSIVPINPKTNRTLPFDNEVIELKLLCEVHGSQHYELNNWHKSSKNNNTTPEYELHKRKLYDRYKRIYAKSKGYFYLEIPYWTDNKQEEWRKLINDKIGEILNLFI